MSSKYFGTDGIRDLVEGPLMKETFVRRLGFAIGRYLERRFPDQSRTVVIGRDTRASGKMIEQTITEGLCVRGSIAYSLGVVPTPAVAMAVNGMNAQMGIVITASHNPSDYNGIKLFNEDGMKLSIEEELKIEKLVEEARPPKDRKADANTFEHLFEDYYVNFIRSLMHKGCLSGWRIALDTANGATTSTTPRVLSHHGAEVFQIGKHPDGSNINAGVGSEYPEAVAALVKKSKARIGVAHDGDGDRLIVVDEMGEILDGDQVLGILALDMLSAGRLNNETLVVTVHSNMGLDKAVKLAGGKVERVAVGDRNVLYAMLEKGAILGGESSGHIICMENSKTGDGLLALVKLLEIMLRTKKPLSVLRQQVNLFPAVNKNLIVKDKKPLETLVGLMRAVAEVEKELDGEGQCLVRFSGTEPKLRLRVEASTVSQAEKCIDLLAKAALEELDVVS